MIEKFVNDLKDNNIELTSTQLDNFKKYYDLIVKYNEVMDLTAVKNEEIYERHFFNSLTVAFNSNFNNKSLCDVGSGAGFPGIPLKILFPDMKLTIVDSLSKRMEFLKIVVKELDLKDVTIINSRIEDIKESFDIVTARAVAPLNILLELVCQNVKTNGYFLAMKGKKATEELQASKKAIETLNYKYESIDIYNNIVFKKIKDTNKKYPRNYSLIKGKPL